MHIGVAGIGRMGAAMALRLREDGSPVTVWNRSPEKAEALKGDGAAVAESPRALAEAADVIITVLTDAAALNAVFGGDAGLLAAEVSGKLFIEMSTVRPETQVRMAEQVRAKGGAYVECAVSGSTGPARQGRLIGLAGGEPADVERARPVLDRLCRRVEHVGPVGTGASVKLTVNLPLMVYYQALGEAYALSRHVGLDPEALIELLSDTSGGPNILKARGSAIAAALKGGTPPVTFDLDSMRKDLRTMIEEGHSKGFDLPVTQRVLEVYDQASRQGWGERDCTTVPSFWAQRGAQAD